MEKRNEQKAMNSSGCAISPKMWFAGGLHLDICFAVGVANSTFLVIVEFFGQLSWLLMKHVL
jgi:hypothetical protein